VKAGNDQHDSQDGTRAKSQILSLTKQLLTGQLGIIAASRELSRLRHEVESDLAEVLEVFNAIDSDTDTLPIGEVRQDWSPEALELKDRQIREAENYYHDAAIEAAIRLLQLLELPS